MANFEEFKQKAKEAVETLADVSVEVYKLAEEKAKVLAKTAKLNTEISRDKSLIKKLYLEIGKKYYELHKDAPSGDFLQSCTEITESFERIETKRREIDELKNSADLSDDDIIDAEIDADEDDTDIEVEIVVENKCGTNPSDE